MGLEDLPWKEVPRETMTAYEKAVRNSRRQSSFSGAFDNDVKSLINRLIDEENYIYPFYVVTITGEPAEGVMGGTTYWEIEGFTCQELSNSKQQLCLNNVHLYMVHLYMFGGNEIIEIAK